MKFVSLLALCVTSTYYTALVTSTPVPQEAKISPSSESNLRKSYLSKQFEDHTKNFILRAQERYESQAEKRKQYAKTKKAYASINQLPVSSTNTNEKSVVESMQLMKRLPMAFWILASQRMEALEDQNAQIKLGRFKRQDSQVAPTTPAPMNIDRMVDYIKEQTQKLGQINTQLQTLSQSVQQGLNKLREQANGSLDSSALTKVFNTFNPSSSTGDSSATSQLSGLMSSAMNSFNSFRKDSSAAPAAGTESAASASTSPAQSNLYGMLTALQAAISSMTSQSSPNDSASNGQLSLSSLLSG